MKKIAIFLIAIALCAVIAFGTMMSPMMQEPISTPIPTITPESAPASSVVSSAPAEPTFDNTDLPMVDIAVDLHRIPADIEDLTAPYQSSWQALCDVLGEEVTTFTFRSSEEKGVLLEAVQALPHASCFNINGSGLGVTIQYSETYADDCLLLTAVAESILRENVYADANELETALILYTYLVTNVELTPQVPSVFTVFDKYKGDEEAVARALCFLLLQFDIPAVVIETDSGTLTAAKINGQCLYFSPAAEMEKENLRGLSCFGMSEAAVQTMFGDFLPPAFAEECLSYALGDVFTNCTDWRLDAVGHNLYLAYGGSDFTAAISTADMVTAHG